MASSPSPAHPELQTYESATVDDATTLVTELRAALGPRLVALLVGAPGREVCTTGPGRGNWTTQPPSHGSGSRISC